MTREQVRDHLRTFASLPLRAPVDAQSLFEKVGPREVARILSALPSRNGVPSHKHLTYGSSGQHHMTKTKAYHFTEYHSESITNQLPSITFASDDPDPSGSGVQMYPGDYLEILWPVREDVSLCDGCGGKGWFDCEHCGGNGMGDVRLHGNVICKPCRGEGGRECPDCDGSGGDRYGTILTVAKTQDDWYIVCATKYSDYYNESWDPDYQIVDQVYFKCDQISGLLSLLSSGRYWPG